MSNDNRRKLYDALSKDYDMGTYEQFCKDIQDDAKRKKLYDATSDAYDYGDYAKFSSQLGFGDSNAAPAPTAAEAVKQEQKGSTAQSKQEEWTPTPMQKAFMIGSAQSSLNSFKAKTDALLEGVRNTSDYYSRGGAINRGLPVKGDLRYNAEAGKMEQTYLTPTGTATADKVAAERETRAYNDYVDNMTVAGQLRRAGRDLEYLTDKAEKRKAEIINKVTGDQRKKESESGLLGKFYQGIRGGDSMVMPSGSFTNEVNDVLSTDREYRSLEAARRDAEKRVRTLQHENDRQNNKNVGFWRGLGEVVGDSRTWDFGLGDLRDATTKVATSSKSNGNRSDAEDLMLGQAFEAQQADAAFGQNDSFWYRAGVMTGEMLPFMLDFAFMGGARGGSSMVTRNLDTVLLRSLHKAAPKVARNKAAQWTTKALGAMPEDLLYRAPLMTNTVQGMKTASDIIDRKLGDVVIREDGTYDFSNDKTWGSAVWQGEANAIIENYSEMFGSHLEGVLSLKTVGKLAETFGAKRLSGILTKASNSELAGIAGTMQKHLNQLGVSDYIGEVGEEYYGQLWRTMLNLDDAYKQNPDGSRTNLFLDGQFHGDIWGGMALSMGLMGAGKYSVSAAAYGSMKHRVNKTDTRAAEVFTPEVWDGWRERIDGTTNDKIGEVAEAIVADPTLTDEQRAAAMNYMEASLNLRGFNLASVARQRGGEMSEDEVAANESYMDGYSVSTPQEMNDAKKMLDLQRQRLASALSEDLVQDFDNDPIGALSIAHDPELRRMASNYVNAKMVYDGMIQRVRDDVDGRIAQSDAMIDSRINRETGMIQPATMKIDDRKVYIVNGSVSMYEDGSGVDAQNSSESIIIRDAVTGKVEFADPTQLFSVDEAIDAEVEKDEARNQIINEVAVVAANNIDGVLSFNPGDTYSILDVEGNQQSVSVLGQTADENGMILEDYVDIQFPDGSIESVATSDLQQWVDDANSQRVELFVNEHRAQRAAADEAAQPDTEINPDENGVIEIPTDQNGEPIYEQAEPDYAWDALVEQTEGDEDIAMSVIEQTISEKEDELKNMSKRKPKTGLSTSQKIQAEKDKKKAMEDIQQSIDHWKRMAGTKQRRQAEEDAIRSVLNLEYQPITKATTNNGTNGSAVLDVNSEDGQDGRPGSNGNADGAEQSQEGMEVSISSHIIRENQLRNKMKSDRLLYKATALDEPANSPAEQPINQGGSLSSDGKDNTLPSVQQEVGSKRSLGEKVKNAETEVNTDPTDKQKEAGNYKKGHVQVGTFDVSIENPKGSKRSGTDADGKKWETTMTHTYGYILGTKGVDGDHIDVYISSDVDGWNGRNAYVVDQYNPDGSFDEHKVMLGFNDKDEAFEAYLSNYEKGWKNGRRLDVTAVNLEDFEKWIESSKRKTKPFADYKSVMPIRYDNQGNPIDHLGKLIVEDVNSIDEITDDDFVKPTRTISLPQLPDVVSEAIGSNKKRVIIKKNIFDKNHKSHRDLTPKDSREILQTALYTPSLYGQNQKQTRPYNWILIHLADKNTCVLLEVDNSKECCEIVNWHYLGGEQLKQKERQAEREGGRILTLSEDNVVGNTSHGLSSVGKDNTFSVDNQISEDANRLSVDESSDKQADKGQSSKGYTIESKPYTNKQGKTKAFAEYKSIKSKEDSSMVGRSLSEQEATDLIAQMEANAEVARELPLTPQNWANEFGTDGIIKTPIGEVKQGDNQYLKLAQQGRNGKLGMIKPTLEHPSIIIEDERPANNGNQDRSTSYVFIKTFVKKDGTRYYHFASITVSKEGKEVVISSQERSVNRISKLLQQGKVTWIDEKFSLHPTTQIEESIPLNDSNRLTSIDSQPAMLGINSSELSSFKGELMQSHSDGKDNTFSVDNQISEDANRLSVDESSDKQADKGQSSKGYTIESKPYTNKQGKTLDTYLVTFDRDFTKQEKSSLRLMAKDKRGWYDKETGGWMLRSREDAEAFAGEVMGKDKTQLSEEAPLSIDDMQLAIKPTSEESTAEKTKVSSPSEETTAEKKAVNPSGNKLVTDEQYAELLAKMRKKMALNMGVDPEVLAIGSMMAVYHIEKGTRKFAEYVKAMVADLGENFPARYLKGFYKAAHEMIEDAAPEIAVEMDSDDVVNTADVASIISGRIDAMATAEMVVEEATAEQEREEAERKLQAYRHLVNKYAQDIAQSPMFKKAVQLMDSENVQEIGSDLYKYYVGEDIETIAQNELYKMFVDQWNIDNGVLQSAIIAEAIRKAHKAIREEQTTVNPDGTTTQNVVENGTEIEITSGDFIPGVRPTVDAQKPGGKKKPGKSKPKPTTDGGLFDTAEDDTTTAPAIAVPEQHPVAELMGDSAAYQERETQTVELVEEISGVIENRVAMLQLDAESVKPLTMTDVKKMAAKYPALKDISDTDLQELVELAMTQLTRSEALINIDGTAEAQRGAFDHIVNLYQIQPSLNARDSERLIKQQYSTPTPFGFVMGQFVRASGKTVGSMLEPSAGNGALTITVHPSVIHVNDIDDARLANLRKLGYGQVTAQDALLPFSGDKVDVVMTNPPFGTVTEKVYDGVFRISSLEGQMAINALEQMKDDGRAAIVIGGNTSYRTNGSMNPKDAAFFGYLYSHYNVADVINISGKALYSRNGTGYDVRMILIDGRKTGEFQRVYPPVKAKARAEQVTTFEDLYKRVQDDIYQIQQMGHQSVDVQRDPRATTDGTASTSVRNGSNQSDTRTGLQPGIASDAVRSTSRTDSGQPTSGNDGSRLAGVDNANRRNAGSTDNVPQPNSQRTRSIGSGSTQDGTGRSGRDGRGTVASQPDRSSERLEVKPDLTAEKVPYPNQSENGFTLMSVVPAAQAQVLQKSLGEIGNVDQYLVDELGYSSKEELYNYLAAEQIDSVALAIHQMNKGNAFIIGDMTGVGKGRQGAALIRYAVKQGKVPIYFTQKPTLFTDNYRDLSDIGSSDLRPFIIASDPKDANIVDTEGKVVHKLPSKKEQERVFKYIKAHGTLPEEYDYVLTTYDQIKNGTADYSQTGDGTWKTEPRKLSKKSKGYTKADYNGQARREALAQLADGNIAILDESHTVGGDSGCGRYMQMLTSSANGVTFLSATFAKRADNMPIYAQRTAIAEAGVKASELIEAISKGGVTLQEIMSKQLVESGQMIRRERNFEGVTIDWMSVEEETDRRQRTQFNEVAAIFNAIRNFQDDYITPLIDAKNESAAEFGATVGHTKGTKDLGVKNVPFASKMYNLVNQLLFALKVDAVADRVIENLRNGYKPVISFTNTMEGFLSSAPKGEVMDEVPNFSLTLMRALDGVMRFTEKDADEKTEGGSISLSELSVEGQQAYNAIRDKIMNLSADLPISPMDAIRMKIEEAGYSVAEITGRTMQLNRTEDERYIVEARKDRDKKAAMRDFNSGKLDVLMINKSGSTGISLHASSKFEDQRPRVMVFAQFQSDINDEVQMRGRIDRSGQVTRGRYEYIMSTIPAEQRMQMMFKAKLKSLDANTTSSQKSKFNEMEIVDYLNKYGDEVVWEYMKEHPELEERLGDPLEMLQEKNAEDGPRTSEKEDTSKKNGCAGKISRYLAFLSVEEQDEIFKEITDAYRVKIQLLDDAGENDLEITTMPLRAETKRKQMWHEGVNPGSGNAFADNTYVEEVEADVLKKPMKRAEIAEATKKLMGEHYAEKNGGVDWQHYVRAKGEEISLFFQAKADEAVGNLKEAGEGRIAKARKKAVSAATKARGRGENNFTDEQIQSLADAVANEEREKDLQKQRKRQEEIMAIKHRIQSLLQRLHAGGIYVVPQDLKQGTAEMFAQTFGTFVGFKFNKGYTLGSSTAIFATLDGRRKVELALSDPAISTIISATEITYRYSPDEISAISMDNWDSKVPTQTRQKRYIITGNLLQALVDTEKGEKTRGNLISYSTIDGETRQGILMGENFKLTDLRNSASLSSRLAQIREGKAVVSENGDVQIEKVAYGWQHRGDYELRVPKSKSRGGIYTMDKGLLKLVDGNNFVTKGNSMIGYVSSDNIAKVVDMLSREPFNLTVLQESLLTDVSAEEAEDDVLCRPVTDKATLDRLNSEPTIKVYRAMQMIDGGLRPPMSGKVDGEWREATEVGVWEEAEEHPEMADEKGRFKLDKGNGKSIKAAYNPYIHTSRSPINDQFSSAWSRPELVTVEVEVPVSELTSGYRAEKAKDTVGEKEWKSGPVGRALAKIGQARRVILSRWSRIVRVVPVEEVAEAYAQRLNAHGIEVPFNTVPPALRDALAERGVKIGKPEKGNAGSASLSAFEQWISEQERQRMGDGNGAYQDADVSMENDPWSKSWGESIRTKRQQKQFAERERNRMRERAKSLSSILGLDIEVVEDASSLKGKKQRAKGWYDTKTGKITVVVSNHNSASDMEATILHEAVAHHGLRQLLGEHFDEFLDKVYAAAENGIKEQIDLLASRNGWNRRVATEEYLAGLAERTDFDRAEERIGGWFDKIKRFFFDMLLKAGFKHITPNSIGDNELRYILWRSYQNLVNPGRYRAFEWEAEDVAMQYDLKVGDYAPHTVSVTEQSVAEAGELYEVNERFNRELQQQIDGTLPEGHVYQLGNPGEVLLSTGVPNLPIQLSAQRLKVKATEYGHNFDLSQIRNLVKELQHPMAVFVYGNKGKMQNIIVGIESNGNQFIVGLSLNPIVQGKALEINSVRNVFPKKNAEWLNWISQGKLLYADKQKIQALIDKQRTILADVEYLDLEDVAKIVENFENPTIKEQNNNAERDEDVRFRDGDFTPHDRKLAADQYERMLSRGSWQFREATQDSMLGLKTLYESIQGDDLRIEDVAGYENAYLYENRMSSTNNSEQHQYFIRFMKPLLESIYKLCGSKELDRRILTDYMMAKHGLERNEYMRNEAAANGEDPDQDFAGLCGLTGEDDWQVAETVARQMVDDYEADHDTAELWDNVKKATNATLEKIYLSGLISEDTYNSVLGMYDFYIPLRGWDETTSDEVYGYLTSKDGPLMGSVFKTAEGRESKADDPIATIAMMADDAIRQGNRNIMKQRFLNFVLGNPSDLVSVNEMWLQRNDVTDEWEPVFADLQPDMTHAEVESEIAKFEAKMESLMTAEPDKYKKGRDARNIPYKVVRGNLNEHQVLVKRNGRTYVMTINGNPRAAQALNGLTNPNVEMGGVIGNMLKLGEYVNRHLSAFYTTRNPDFVVSNFMRDMLYSNCMTWVKENPRYALRFHKNFGKVNPLTLRRLLSKWENDNLNDSNYLEKMFKEFMLNGGETGYTLVRDIERYKRTIASELKKQGGTGRMAWNALCMQLDLLNRSVENCARFAAFLTSREMGRTLDRSIYDAKEVSVNFNKKGSGGKFVNATGQKLLGKIGSYLGGGGRMAFVFWNAGVQGMTNFGRAGKRNPSKAIGGVAALFTLGYVIPLLAQMLGGGDGDDDDKNAYYNLPEYVRRSNICFKAGEQWITIPLPIEYRSIYGMGELACGVISGNERYSNSELARQMASQVSQAMPLDMLEGGGGISPFIPSAFKPMTEAYILNKGWTGLPVYKDTPYNKNDPEWTKAYQSADQHLVEFTRWLNETSGGNDYKKGTIDINPAKLEYLLTGTFGGAVRTIGKLKKMGETAFGEREFEWRNMLLANPIVKSGDERTANRKLQNEYFKYLNEYEETKRLFKKYENAEDDGILGYAERADFLYNSPEYLRCEIFEEFKPDIDAIREEIKEETDSEAMKDLQNKLFATLRELVDKLHDVDK